MLLNEQFHGRELSQYRDENRCSTVQFDIYAPNSPLFGRKGHEPSVRLERPDNDSSVVAIQVHAVDIPQIDL